MYDNIVSELDKIDIVHRLTTVNMEMDLHFHNSFEMIFIKSGKAVFKIDNKVYNVAAGNLIFLSNLEKHELKVTEFPYDRYIMLINPDHFLTEVKNPILSSIFRHRPEHFCHVLDISSEKDSYIENLLNNMLTEYNGKELHYNSALSSFLILLLIHLHRNYTSFFPVEVMNRTTSTIIEIQKYIDQNSQSKLNLKDIAKKYYIDMYYLSRIFKNITGYSFKEYIILQRISKAKNLLFFTTEDITQVGLRSGFNNTNHFIKLFKKYEGITPYQYRKQTLKQKKEGS